jgi:hypothetical protein
MGAMRELDGMQAPLLDAMLMSPRDAPQVLLLDGMQAPLLDAMRVSSQDGTQVLLRHAMLVSPLDAMQKPDAMQQPQGAIRLAAWRRPQ